MRQFLLAVPALFLLLVPVHAAEKSIEELIRQLNSETFADREQAAKDLVALGPKVLAALRNEFQNSEKEIARRAKDCVAQIERNEQIKALITDLQNDRDPKRRTAAITGLEELKVDNARFVPVLIKALDDSDIKVRRYAASALVRIKPPARDAISRILEIIKDATETDDIRWSMMLSISYMEQCEERAAPILLDMLESRSWKLRQGAALALGLHGQKDSRSAPALLKALKDPNDDVQGSAAISLGRLGKDAEHSVPALMELLRSLKNNPNENGRMRVVLRALQSFERKATEAVPLICEIAADVRIDERLRLAAIETLGELGSVARGAIPVLKEISRSTANTTIKDEAREAESRILKNLP